MRQAASTSQPLLSRPMKAVVVAQFLSALGDNALLFATLALIKQQLYPDWSQPILQIVFVASYIVLAPFVGVLADAQPKGRVMMIGNGLKLLGALVIIVGLNPFFGYTLVGMGAAIYSPAKYGILGEIARDEQLVKANSLVESSTIAAILMGSVAGGMLADWHVVAALMLCVLVYAGAMVVNYAIPYLTPAFSLSTRSLKGFIGHFWQANVHLWRDPEVRFTLLGTSLFWGAGVTLRFLLVIWVPLALGVTDNTMPTVLNALVAVGIVIGAALAARFISLKNVQRCMPAGILIGVAVVVFVLQNSVWHTALTLIVVGVFGGFFVVPLNALLQEKGKASVGAGNAVAVQNLAENSAMLLMLAFYTVAVKSGIAIMSIGIGFGALFATAIAVLWWHDARKK